jgi:hypothetical protein
MRSLDLGCQFGGTDCGSGGFSWAGFVGEGGGIVLHPPGLKPGVGDTEAAGGAEAVKGVFRSQTFAAEQAGDEQTRPSDSGKAVGPDGFAGAEVGVEAIDEALEFGHGFGDGVVGNRQGEMVDARLAAQFGFGLELEDAGFLRLKERDEGVNSVGA